MASEASVSRLKPADIGHPRLRGVLHAYGFFAAIVSGVVLCVLAAARPGVAAVASCVIYSCAVCALFGVSALFHRRVWTPRRYLVMKRLDHSMIFLFIAGTYTPLAVLLLEPTGTVVILSIAWGGGLLGVVTNVLWPRAPRWFSSPVYIALGSIALTVMPDFLDRGGAAVVALIVGGGVLYIVGAILYALRWPNPWPTVFAHHEIFHALILTAAVCHQLAIYLVVYA